MRVVLLGATGQLGSELFPMLAQFAEVVAPTRAQAQLDDADALAAFVRAAAPDVIVNCASWNDVDGAEADEAGAMRVNRDAVARLGEAARTLGAGLVHYSTDFVFDGEKGAPYGEHDAPSPLGAYARSKVAGEQALRDLDAPAIVLRTAWVYTLRQKSFVSSILGGARRREELRVVDDQVGHPTFARDLAVCTALILRAAGPRPHDLLREARGLYHAVGGGTTSRHALAVAALALDPRRHEQIARQVLPVPTSSLSLPARRPLRVELRRDKLHEVFGVQLPDWQDALRRAMADLLLYEPKPTWFK